MSVTSSVLVIVIIVTVIIVIITTVTYSELGEIRLTLFLVDDPKRGEKVFST
jgi:hypothetical protein